MATCVQLTVSLTPELIWRQRNLTELREKGWACFRYTLSRRTRRRRGWGVYSGAGSVVIHSCSE